MSGHSKWSQIKRQKGVADVKRGMVFTKFANAITIAVREGGGGDPVSNFKLRLVMDTARAANMPKENMQRAIDRGLGKAGAGGQLESLTYESYGSGKVAIIIEVTTDNKNRTTGEVKSLIEKSGGSFVSPGTVSWMFTDCGVITLSKNGKTFDEIFEACVDAGADDVTDLVDLVEVYTKPKELEVVRRVLVEKGFDVQSAELSKKPITIVEVNDKDAANKILALMEKLESLDDVQKVFGNFEIPDNLLTS